VKERLNVRFSTDPTIGWRGHEGQQRFDWSG
jgi:hypothetical protein